jgi:hypothetical protein
MRALALMVRDDGIDFQAAKRFYQPQGKRNMDRLVENTVLEQLFLALHHLSTLEGMEGLSPTANFSRVGILAWYYGIANAAAAMTAAKNSSFQEDHAGTARMWDLEIAARGLAMGPYAWRVSSLVEGTFKHEVDAYRGSSTANLQSSLIDAADARSAAAGYLSGSAKWYAWRTTEDVRRTAQFKHLGVDNFRTKAARELRDARLSQRPIGFVHQAARYRGKANYREALFLAYGKSTEATLTGFVADQAKVLRAFVAMAGAFVSRKVGNELFEEFVADVDAHRAFSLSAASVWS